MKRNGLAFRLGAALLALVLILSCGYALAEGERSSCPAAESETVAALLTVPDFKFFVRENGIGKGSCPVYTAPSEDSLRLSDGNAVCNVEAEISVGGYENNWLMVRCEIKDKKARVGYIPPQYSRHLNARVSKLAFDAIPVKLAEDADITDNPRSNSTPFGTLKGGTDITVLGKYTYTGNWWYVETTLDGKLTRGFINRSEAALEIDGRTYAGNDALGYPALSPMNTARVGMITIRGNEDDAMIVRKRANTNASMVARVYGGETFPCYGEEKGANDRPWYYIWVDGVWGWFSSGIATFSADN